MPLPLSHLRTRAHNPSSQVKRLTELFEKDAAAEAFRQQREQAAREAQKVCVWGDKDEGRSGLLIGCHRYWPGMGMIAAADSSNPARDAAADSAAALLIQETPTLHPLPLNPS